MVPDTQVCPKSSSFSRYQFPIYFRGFTFTVLCLQLLTHGGQPQPARLLCDSISRASRRCLQTSKRRRLIFWFCRRSLAIAVVSELEDATEPALARRHSTPRPPELTPSLIFQSDVVCSCEARSRNPARTPRSAKVYSRSELVYSLEPRKRAKIAFGAERRPFTQYTPKIFLEPHCTF
ncbi:Hypothetical_protein [Hexamita inflata]|uniref:Hypothetical_protein n=1 Tax=Hexamita inflata TaxID=28002 RepID=A0AA86U4Q5_9EUKA|nr:Hypothetical protein HINF_LOCUS30090 [Hexamita inflata]